MNSDANVSVTIGDCLDRATELGERLRNLGRLPAHGKGPEAEGQQAHTAEDREHVQHGSAGFGSGELRSLPHGRQGYSVA